MPGRLRICKLYRVDNGRVLFWALAAIGSFSLVGYWALYANASLSRDVSAVGSYVYIFCGLFVIYLLACVLVLQWSGGKGRCLRACLVLIAVVAVLARGVLVFAPPTLSDDMYRYIWDGRVMSAGISPYAYPPGAPEVASLHPDGYWIWDNINRKGAITVYPPGAELFYAGVYQVYPDSVTWTKAALVLVDLLNCLVLFFILRRLNMSPLRTLIYAWAPLPVIEFGSSGHVETLSVLFTLLAILAGVVAVQNGELENKVQGSKKGQLGRATALAAMALAGAALVKLVPLLLLVGWVRQFGWRFAAFCVGVVAVVYVGFVGAFNWHVSPFLLTYLRDEENNAPLYYLLGYVLAPATGLPDGVVRAGLIGALMALALYIFLSRVGNRYDFIGKSFVLVGAYLFLATSAHQWYATWLLLFVPLVLPPGGLRVMAREGDGDENDDRGGGSKGVAIAALAYTGLTFLGYGIFALKVSTIPEPILAMQLAVMVGLGILWSFAGWIYKYKRTKPFMLVAEAQKA